MVTIVLTVEDPWSALDGPFLSFAQIVLENAHHFLLRPRGSLVLLGLNAGSQVKRPD